MRNKKGASQLSPSNGSGVGRGTVVSSRLKETISGAPGCLSRPEHATLDLRVVSSSPTFSVEITKINKFLTNKHRIHKTATAFHFRSSQNWTE